MNNNKGSDITKDDIGRIDSFYAFINYYSAARILRFEEIWTYLERFGLNVARVVLFLEDSKHARLRIMFQILISGNTFRLRDRYVKTWLTTSIFLKEMTYMETEKHNILYIYLVVELVII